MKYAAIATLILATSMPAMAQQGPGLIASIPFSFEVSDRVMPAGEYRLTYLATSPILVRIEDRNLKLSAFVMAGLMSPEAKTLGETYVSFNRYDDRYFLGKVIFLDRNCAVMKSRSEHELVTSKVLKAALNRPVEVKIMAAVR